MTQQPNDNSQEKNISSKEDGIITEEKNSNSEELNFFLGGHSHSHKRKSKRRNKKRKKALSIILISIATIIAILLGTFFALFLSGKNQLVNHKDTVIDFSQVEEDIIASEEDGKSITYKGEEYVYNDDVTTILCMGIDKTEDLGGSYGKNGQADAIILLTIDPKSGKTNVIPINRDTMVYSKLYSSSGNFIKTEKQQICLVFANGDGEEKSCKNMKDSVSSMLYGIPIDSYIAIDLNAIGPLNQAVGGVTVKSPETFTIGKTTFNKGESYYLGDGKTATAFVQWRDKSKLDSNATRMARQKVYLSAFAKAAINKTKQDIKFPLSLYNSVSKYNTNDLSASKITYLTSKVMLGNDIKLNFLELKGKTTKGEKYAEFTPDRDALLDLVIKVFYTKK